jgi:RimJ/RimL family protein N-acetyltransferase
MQLVDASKLAVEAPVLSTERLTLRPFAPENVDDLHELLTDVDVRRHLLDDVVVSREWVEEEILSSQARFVESGCGLWTLEERSRDSLVGFVGFRPFFDPPELQLLYGLLPSHWGRGLATEAAAAAVDYAFGVLGLDEVRAATDAPNTASIAVLQRLGMRERHRTEDGEGGTVFFHLLANDWLGRVPGTSIGPS